VGEGLSLGLTTVRFSVSESNKSAVIAYIVSQELHHRKMTFQEEIRALLTKHSMRYDERYIWD
jgi:putative transposase